MKYAIVLLLAGMLTGCASYAAVPGMHNPLAEANLTRDPQQLRAIERSLTDDEIAKLLDADIRARIPTSLAVAKIESQCRGYQPMLVNPPAEEMECWQKAAAGLRGIESVLPVSTLALETDRPTLHALRQAAARQGCELLLVYIQVDGEVSNYNDAAVLYWTFAGLWLVPGHSVEHKTVMQGLLLDCRTGMILGTASGDCHLKGIATAAAEKIKREELARQAPPQALADLQKATSAMLTRVVAASANHKGKQLSIRD